MRHNMRAERARKGLSIARVAEEIGVHANAVARWESGETEPTASNLLALSALYGCPPEHLLNDTDDGGEDE